MLRVSLAHLLPARVRNVGLVFGFSFVGLTMSIVIAGGLAWFIEAQVTDLLLANVAARASEQVDHLGLTGYVTTDDFVLPHSADHLASIATRLDPMFARMTHDGTGVIRLQMFAPDGTVLYSDLPDKRGAVLDQDDQQHLADALAGETIREVSNLEGEENIELKATHEQALEVYVPVALGDQIVGVYEIYQDMAPVAAVRPMVWGAIVSGFGLLLLALSGVVRTAAVLIRRQQHALAHHELHDVMTNLPNRALFLDRLAHALARRAPNPVAVLFVNLGGLKLVNDSLGHAAGDGLLVGVAQRLLDGISAADSLARVGGNEFGILLEDVRDASAAVIRADTLLTALCAPLAVGERELFPTASIGIALSTPENASAEALLRDADIAAERARRRGKDTYQVFNAAMASHAAERLTLETDLRKALERGEFRVHYQPILALDNGHIGEVEALVRWEHPQRGLIPPMSFIPAAEDTGLIVALGQWILEEACRQAATWHAAFGDAAPVMGVNLSARQFQRPELLVDVRRALRLARLDPSGLKLEITESVVMADAEATLATLRALRALGIGLAIDDFGTGYSSLAYLKNFPVDTLKVDRSFVSGLGVDRQDTAIVQSVVALARALGLSVTAEGVETETQNRHLRALGCDRGQGYLYARPQAADAITELLTHNNNATSLRAA